MEEFTYGDFEKNSENIKHKDVENLVKNDNVMKKKLAGLDERKFVKLYRQVKLAFEMLKDYTRKNYTDVPWRTIGLLTLAVLYFINPLDVIPDMVPIFGFADDAVLMAAVVKSLQEDLINYCAFKGFDPAEYFNNK